MGKRPDKRAECRNRASCGTTKDEDEWKEDDDADEDAEGEREGVRGGSVDDSAEGCCRLIALDAVDEAEMVGSRGESSKC